MNMVWAALLLLAPLLAGCENGGLLQSADYARLHPAFHAGPAEYWMNDPNGMFFHRGVYHVFYQASPESASWNRISWGHSISRDLAHWTRLPGLALTVGPAGSPDELGVFSGSITVVDGAPLLVYTCVGSTGQQQCSAVPEDVDDPQLRVWTKRGLLNMSLPPGGNFQQWRDPSAAWQTTDGAWRLLLGAQLDECRAVVTAYESSGDLERWAYAGEFFSPHAQECGMIECPSAFPLPGPDPDAWLLIYGDTGRRQGKRIGAGVGVVGSIVGGRFLARAAPAMLDGGDVYASQTLLAPDGSRVLLGWVLETRAGAAQMGWQGCLTLPRVLSLAADNVTLLQQPSRALALLRSPPLLQLSAAAAEEAATRPGEAFRRLSLPASATGGAQRELSLTFQCALAELLHAGGECGASVLLFTGRGEEHTQVSLRISPGNATGKLLVHMERSGGLGEGKTLHMPFKLLDGSTHRLRLFIDHSVLEAYAGRGEAVVTARIYPEADTDGPTDWELAVLRGGGAKLTELRAWDLSSAYQSS